MTTGGLGPTADDLTAEIVGGFAGREMVLDEEMESEIAGSSPASRGGCKFDPEALRGANPQAGDGPGGRDRRSTPPGPPRASSFAADGPVVIVLPGPPRELQAMWPAALATPGLAAVLDRAEPLRERDR